VSRPVVGHKLRTKAWASRVLSGHPTNPQIASLMHESIVAVPVSQQTLRTPGKPTDRSVGSTP
jgi:hypothetical protein